MRKILIISITCLTLVSCNYNKICSKKYPCPQLDSVQTSTTITEILRDTIIEFYADTALMEAWFECDSNNRVIMTKLVNLKNEKPKIVTKYETDKQVLNITATIPKETIKILLKDKLINTALKYNYVKTVEVNKKTKVDIFLQISGIIFWGGIFVLILLLIVARRK